jgi:hypothetical protein
VGTNHPPEMLRYDRLCPLLRTKVTAHRNVDRSCHSTSPIGLDVVTRRKIRYGLALLAFNPSESIAPCILLIVVNVRTGTPSNPSEALENIGIVVGPILADADDAVVVDVRASYYSPLNTFLPCCNGGSPSSRSCRLFHLSLFGKHIAVVCRL